MDKSELNFLIAKNVFLWQLHEDSWGKVWVPPEWAGTDDVVFDQNADEYQLIHDFLDDPSVVQDIIDVLVFDGFDVMVWYDDNEYNVTIENEFQTHHRSSADMRIALAEAAINIDRSFSY